MAEAAFGGTSQVSKHWDEKGENEIDILMVADRPKSGIDSFTTVGLYAYPVLEFSGGIPLSVELMGVCTQDFPEFANILSACAFNIINSHFRCSPGTVYREIVSGTYPDSKMKHILFIPPFLWEESLQTIDLENGIATWLLAVPISDEELDYLDDHGLHAMERKIEEEQIAFFNLERPSSV